MASSSRWQRAAVSLLASRQSPRVFTLATLRSHLADAGILLKASTLSAAIPGWLNAGTVVRVGHGIYLNQSATPTPSEEEAAPLIRRGAIISMQSVLARHGVLRSKPAWISCVLPLTRSQRNVGMVETTGATFRFAGIRRDLIPTPGDAWFEDAMDLSAPIPSATPEKALLDWLYLASQPAARHWTPPCLDQMEFSHLDHSRLARLSTQTGIEVPLR